MLLSRRLGNIFAARKRSYIDLVSSKLHAEKHPSGPRRSGSGGLVHMQRSFGKDSRSCSINCRVCVVTVSTSISSRNFKEASQPARLKGLAVSAESQPRAP